MKKLLIFFLLLLCSHALLQAQTIEWQKSLGGSDYEYASSIEQTTDGGFIVAGYTHSNDGDVSGNHDTADCWIVKLDASGFIQWQKCLGGSNDDGASSAYQTADGGFIVAGTTASNDGDVSGNHGDYDGWLVKLNSSGNIQWQKCLGGSSADDARALNLTADGGYIVAGSTLSNDDEVSGNHGLYDYSLVKLDSIGNIQWQKSLGGSGRDIPYSVEQTSDGGFIAAGHSNSTDGDVTSSSFSDNYWIVKLDASGNLEWEKSLGGSQLDWAYSVQQINDGGFIVAGYSGSNDGDVSGNHGSNDLWIIKLNSEGDIQWQKSLGGSATDGAHSIHQTTDGGFIVAGWSLSTDGDVTGNHGSIDYWITKLDSSGSIQWQKSLGGSNDEVAFSIQQTTDGGFIIAGGSSSNDGDVSGNHGDDDYWVVKLSALTGIASVTGSEMFSVYPNPAQSQLTVTLSTAADETTIQVFDLCGRVIPVPVAFHDDKAELNIELLAGGLYTIQIIDNRSGKIEKGKFVVMK